MQPVSLTAQWTAAIRALESERSELPLFQDPLARDLAYPDGFTLLDRYQGGGVQEFVTIRTHYVDQSIAYVMGKEASPRQVVFLAAGMDTRAYRLSWPEEATFFELDHAALLEEKRRRLEAKKIKARVDRVPVPADLAQDWTLPLRAAGFRNEAATLWVAEGLLFFLTEEQVRSLLKVCADLSAPGSWMITDMTSQALLRNPFTQGFLKTLEKDGTPWRFGTDTPESFLESLGWLPDQVCEPGDEGVSNGRWPYATTPREVGGLAPRNWLVRARISA